MRSTRKRYHIAVKGLLRSQTDLRNSCLAEASINKPPNVFWRKVERVNARPLSVHVLNVFLMDIAIVMLLLMSLKLHITNEFYTAHSVIFYAGFTMADDLKVLREELDESCINSFCLGKILR